MDISTLHHGDIVNLIKDSGYSVVLTVGPPLGMYFKICEVQAKKNSVNQLISQNSGVKFFSVLKVRFWVWFFCLEFFKKFGPLLGGNQFCTGILYHNQL